DMGDVWPAAGALVAANLQRTAELRRGAAAGSQSLGRAARSRSACERKVVAADRRSSRFGRREIFSAQERTGFGSRGLAWHAAAQFRRRYLAFDCLRKLRADRLPGKGGAEVC